MSEQPSFRSCCSEAPFASRDRERAVSVQNSPRQNRLLAALPVEDYGYLLPFLEPVPLPLGWTVHGAGDRGKYLYFLTSGIVSRFNVTENGASAAFAITGCEGVIGVALFLGGKCAPSQTVVLSPGYAYRLGADRLKTEFENNVPLRNLLLRYTLVLIGHTAQIGACNRYHSVEQQLCRVILGCLDRSPSNEVAMTQELIASVLGVRREGVTEAAGRLQKAGLIHYRRGHIAVLDRPQLEARACECYAVVKREYVRMLSNIGEPKSLKPKAHISAARTALASIGAYQVSQLDSFLALGQDLLLMC